MEGKNIIGLIFFFVITIGQAQENRKLEPPKWTQKKYSFAHPELEIDSVFIKNLHSALFDGNNCYLNKVRSNLPEETWRHFFIQFEKKDSLNYCIEVSLWDIPARIAIGFLNYDGFLYWFGDDTPPGIIVETKSKKKFSYIEPLPGPYDPPFWYLMYNIKTGDIEMKEDDDCSN